MVSKYFIKFYFNFTLCSLWTSKIVMAFLIPKMEQLRKEICDLKEPKK